MKKFWASFTILTTLAASASSLFGQDDACLRRTVSLSVSDRNWSPIPDMTPSDFHAEFRGNPVKILSIVPDNRPHRIVILLDASGSMGSTLDNSVAEWPLVFHMGMHLLQSGLKQTRFGVLIFNEKVREQIDFSDGPAAAIQRLQQIQGDPNYVRSQVKGRTALWDSVLVGFSLLRDPSSADAIYLISDAGEDASKATSDDLRRRLAASGTRIFVSLVATSERSHRSRSPDEINGLQETIKLAGATGGAVFGPATRDSKGPYLLNTTSDHSFTVSDGLNGFYKTILGGYRMEIQLPSTVDKWRQWKLELTKEKQKQFRDSQLGYTRDLAPCSATAD